MAVRRVQLRRGTTAENNAFTGAIGEVTVDTQTNSIRVHDNDQAGALISCELICQTMPQSPQT